MPIKQPRKVTIFSSSAFPQQAERIEIHVEGSERFLRLEKTEGQSLDNQWWRPRRVLLKEAIFFGAMAILAIKKAQARKHEG